MKPEILPPHHEHVQPNAKEFVVVKTQYPSTYGANRGRTYTKPEFYRQCDIDVFGPNGKDPDPNKETFVNYEDALKFAREMRDNNEWFTDHTYTNSDDAPFDSSCMNDYDNDEELLIQVMTKTDFGIKMQRLMEAIYGGQSRDDGW